METEWQEQRTDTESRSAESLMVSAFSRFPANLANFAFALSSL